MTHCRCDNCGEVRRLRSMVVLGRGLYGSLLCPRCAKAFRRRSQRELSAR